MKFISKKYIQTHFIDGAGAGGVGSSPHTTIQGEGCLVRFIWSNQGFVWMLYRTNLTTCVAIFCSLTGLVFQQEMKNGTASLEMS